MEKYLTKLSFWNMLSDNEKQQVSNSAIIKKYEKNVVVHSCDKNCLGLVYIISGRLRIYLLSEEGKEATLYYLGGEEVCVLAASCVMSQITFHTEMVTMEDTEMLIIPANMFGRLTKNNIYAKCFMYELSTKRFSDAMWAMQQILFFRLDQRIAQYLYDKAQTEGLTSLRLTQEQISTDINSAREAVARMLKQLSNDGIIEYKRGTINLINMDALRILAKIK